jgi:hypothetical protein
MIRKIAGLAGIAAVVSLVYLTGALAGGGNYISNAPDLPIGTQVVSGCLWANRNQNWDYCAEFWRVNLSSGDLLVIDYGTTNGYRVGLCLLSPGITDYTYSEAGCNDLGGSDDYTDTKHEKQFIASVSGKWTLVVKGLTFGGDLAYEFTARVRHFTSTTMSAPLSARRGTRVWLRGTVSGASAGTVQIQDRTSAKTKALGSTKIQANGSYAYRVRLGTMKKTYRYRAIYYGDSSHRSSLSKIVKIRAT